ncbi:MAG: ABC transporter ATP-binding protein [Cyclobacteriaceae bacterium]|jgi:putative ABC transport system ATP-binding protein|nr:ABC transporter ATP-binding protein [Cyclobacteriaceae bacterium]MDB4315316.1 ABC transporter ATP-binding protein [Cyclobacteriaceae bacterium]MDB4742554.1 ABC transporter ATP-binding protein [Cyclobacteriaceae bacterium]|tara:strand:+ start:4874 stop:5557 length:684 start_codon:yes stop_codon:yes gene_type:complete
MKVIELKNLSKIYNPETIPVRAINDVTLSVEEGEFTAIVGPSGCGKTTLLNMIGGLDISSEGSVDIGGVSINEMSESELTTFRLQHIGFVFQAYNLIPVLTAKENIEFIMVLQNRDAKTMQERSDDLLDRMGIKDQRDRRPSELSGGQQQRVAVARALASRPKFVLADEPTANLDSGSTEALLDIMAKLNKEEKITFIFSTHDQRVIDRAKRIIKLVDGEIVSDEQP